MKTVRQVSMEVQQVFFETTWNEEDVQTNVLIKYDITTQCALFSRRYECVLK